MFSSAALITISAIAFIAIMLGAFAFMFKSELEATAKELAVARDDELLHRSEIERLRTQQARKIDRALWMLTSARLGQLKAPSESEAPNFITISLSDQLVRALRDRTPTSQAGVFVSPGDREILTRLVAEHITRRLAEQAATV